MLKHFLDTVETIEDGVGFSYFGPIHLMWLGLFVILCVGISKYYCKQDTAKRTQFRKLIAWLIVADEAFKVIMLCIGGNYIPKYLPFHLCSLNIFFILLHAYKPSPLLDNFIYSFSTLGAIAALLFPTWVSLPFCNFMHLHSFTVHMLLAIYPIMLVAGKDIIPDYHYIYQVVMMMLIIAIPVYFINILCNTNFLFIMYPEPGNPLMWFYEKFGNHLIGFPVLGIPIFTLLYFPFRKKRV